MKTVAIDTTGNILEKEIVNIIKGSQDYLRIPFTEQEQVDSIKKELVQNLRDIRKERESAIFFIAATEVQISLSLEQKKTIESAIQQTKERMLTETDAKLTTGLEAAFWRSMKMRKKLIKEIAALFEEKQQYIEKLREADYMRTGIHDILNNPIKLRQAAMEPITVN